MSDTKQIKAGDKIKRRVMVNNGKKIDNKKFQQKVIEIEYAVVERDKELWAEWKGRVYNKPMKSQFKIHKTTEQL